jgi:hypothetical protein
VAGAALLVQVQTLGQQKLVALQIPGILLLKLVQSQFELRIGLGAKAGSEDFNLACKIPFFVYFACFFDKNMC